MVNLWIALALGVIFIIITVVVMGTLGVNMFGKMLKGFFSMALKVGVIALFVYWLVELRVRRSVRHRYALLLGY